MQNKFESLKLKQSEIADQLVFSFSTLQKYRTKKASNTNLDNISNRECYPKKPQMTSNDLVKSDTITEATVKRTSYLRNKNVLKGGSF